MQLFTKIKAIKKMKKSKNIIFNMLQLNYLQLNKERIKIFS